jgi:hypothetical protein
MSSPWNITASGGDNEDVQHRIEIDALSVSIGFVTGLELEFEDVGIEFSWLGGGSGTPFQMQVADLKRGLDIVIQHLIEVGAPPETRVRVVGTQGITLRLGDLTRG